jgi:hypothetical protein
LIVEEVILTSIVCRVHIVWWTEYIVGGLHETWADGSLCIGTMYATVNI